LNKIQDNSLLNNNQEKSDYDLSSNFSTLLQAYLFTKNTNFGEIPKSLFNS